MCNLIICDVFLGDFVCVQLNLGGGGGDDFCENFSTMTRCCPIDRFFPLMTTYFIK